MFIFFNDTATTEIYTLSLHDALPIFDAVAYSYDPALGAPLGEDITADDWEGLRTFYAQRAPRFLHTALPVDRKSTRLNSSHANISYAVFCLIKKRYLNVDSGDLRISG